MWSPWVNTERHRHWLFVVLVAVWSLGCGESSQQAADTARDSIRSQPPSTLRDRLLLASAKVALPPAGIVLGDLPHPESRGAGYVDRYCTACHELPSPLAHSATDWPGVLRRMWLRAERIDTSFNVPVPNAGERMLILQYMIDNALRVSGVALPPGRDREFFSRTCSQCHDLPDPMQHSAQDWRAVVRRMMDHMEQILNTTLVPDDMDRIVRYLENVTSR